MTTQPLNDRITAALETVKEQYSTLSAAREQGFSPAELPKLERTLVEFEKNCLFELDDGRRIDLGDLLVLRDVARENQIGLERLLKGERVTLDDRGRIEKLNVSQLGLTSLNLSGLTSLTELDATLNQLTSIHLWGLAVLTNLNASDNRLISLDLSMHAALSYLDVSYNELTSLNFSLNTELTVLDLSGNHIASLDLSNNTALTHLYPYDNQLTSLDLSRNTALTYIYANNNQLTSLELSKNTALTDLWAANNQLLSTLTLPASAKKLRGSAAQTKLPESKLKELEALGMKII